MGKDTALARSDNRTVSRCLAMAPNSANAFDTDDTDVDSLSSGHKLMTDMDPPIGAGAPVCRDLQAAMIS